MHKHCFHLALNVFEVFQDEAKEVNEIFDFLQGRSCGIEAEVI